MKTLKEELEFMLKCMEDMKERDKESKDTNGYMYYCGAIFGIKECLDLISKEQR